MGSRYPVCWSAAASRAPSPRDRVDQRPTAATIFFPAEEAFAEPIDDPFAGIFAVEAAGKAAGKAFDANFSGTQSAHPILFLRQGCGHV